MYEQAADSDIDSGKLNLPSLTALVVGSMIGGGIFSLPQNMLCRQLQGYGADVHHATPPALACAVLHSPSGTSRRGIPWQGFKPPSV